MRVPAGKEDPLEAMERSRETRLTARRPTNVVGRPIMRLRNTTVGAVLCIALLAFAGPAFAASSAEDSYSEPAGSVQQQLDPRGDDNHSVPPSSTTERHGTNASNNSLPFTGLDIALVVAAGGVLLAMGLGIRRLSRAETA
jgi:hypothetical protein